MSDAQDSRLTDDAADSISDADLSRVLEKVPLGALTLAGAAMSLLLLGWLAIYFFVFLPRGPIS